jgi:hypothetical protein
MFFNRLHGAQCCLEKKIALHWHLLHSKEGIGIVAA